MHDGQLLYTRMHAGKSHHVSLATTAELLLKGLLDVPEQKLDFLSLGFDRVQCSELFPQLGLVLLVDDSDM